VAPGALSLPKALTRKIVAISRRPTSGRAELTLEVSVAWVAVVVMVDSFEVNVVVAEMKA
jgi:hypothetical protein